ncbi:MAG: hypothetical protein ABSH49_12840 [Bryobacteraceae bacterium]|jgi:hypothetical protein
MGETLSKLTPNRDLQCYFQEPTAVAALSQTSATGFTVSGCWRQQFDWAVVEWNRDNVFEHPALRNLPDGDLSGLVLGYQETRTNCIAMDSTWYPTVDCPYLRIWADTGGTETVYKVPLTNYATPIGSDTPATTQITLQGTVTAGDYIVLAWLDQQFNYQVTANDDLSSAAAQLAAIISGFYQTGASEVNAAAQGAVITLTYYGSAGANGNRVGVYGTASGAGTETWGPASALFSGGVSPQSWQVELNFSEVQGYQVNSDGSLTAVSQIPTTNVRKLRWTWAADVQATAFARSEFSVVVTNWTVTGSNLAYSVAGPGSRRIEDNSTELAYTGSWLQSIGNFSGGSIHYTTEAEASIQCQYTASATHSLYLGTRMAGSVGSASVQIDGGSSIALNLELAGEDVLLRVSLGEYQAGSHAVKVTNTGASGSYFYFDFLELAMPTETLPSFGRIPKTTAATDWDTNHSLALAPERTAWLIGTLGFQGRANHYAGALWFYELVCPANQYASGTVQFGGVPAFGDTTELVIDGTTISHLNLIGDTATSMATCFALLINEGSTAVWAAASGTTLTITARAPGSAGNSLSVSASTGKSAYTATVNSTALTGGTDGTWLTDLTAVPRLNRAARDWTSAFLSALQAYGITPTVSFSMELGNGDATSATGIAQCYPDGSPVRVSTPALQTNFSPASLTFWRQVYLDMANLMAVAGVVPYLQFGEVQWWYFASAAGMPFYDAYTTSTFQSTYGKAMGLITSQNADPTQYPDECQFLPNLIGAFTSSIRAFVRQTHPGAKFEVLYPPDTNDTALNAIVNFPVNDWTPANLSCLKTENFTYTGNRDLDAARTSIHLPGINGFPPPQSSHLIGISDYTTPWQREWNLTLAAGDESAVLFALDQFCLIGYSLPLTPPARRSQYLGG